MATIKGTSNALGNLINTINSTPSAASVTSFPSISVDDDSIPTSLLNPEPVFQMNYKSTRKQCIKKAKDQLQIIVKEVIPKIIQNSAMIVDKINQDAETLGSLYYEYEKNEKMIQAAMEAVARGELQPRMFEIYQKLADLQQKLSTRITETQNNMRKYYIDSYMDIQQKDSLDEHLCDYSKEEPKAIEEPKQTKSDNVVVGTNQTVQLLNEKKKQALIAKYEEIK